MLRDLYAYREMVRLLTQRDLILLFGGSRGATLIGVALHLVRPLLMVLALLAGLRPMLKDPIENYTVFVAVGLLHWHLLTACLQAGSQSIRNQASLVTRSNFPRVVLPFSSLMVQIIRIEITGLLFYFLAFPALGGVWSLTHLLYVPVIFLYSMFLFGLCMATSVLQVHLEDTRDIASFVAHLALWLSPILHRFDRLHGHYYQLLLQLNPLVPYLNSLHGLFCYQSVPPWEDWSAMVLWANLSLALGALLFRRLEKGLVDQL